jgi:hypothetical protein
MHSRAALVAAIKRAQLTQKSTMIRSQGYMEAGAELGGRAQVLLIFGSCPFIVNLAPRTPGLLRAALRPRRLGAQSSRQGHRCSGGGAAARRRRRREPGAAARRVAGGPGRVSPPWVAPLCRCQAEQLLGEPARQAGAWLVVATHCITRARAASSPRALHSDRQLGSRPGSILGAPKKLPTTTM